LSSQAGNGGIQGDAVQPGAEFCLSAEGGPGSPELNDDLLEKVLAVGLGKAIQSAYFIKHAAVFVHQSDKFLLYSGVLQWKGFEDNS
jgi:hypothetical protein